MTFTGEPVVLVHHLNQLHYKVQVIFGVNLLKHEICTINTAKE